MDRLRCFLRWHGTAWANGKIAQSRMQMYELFSMQATMANVESRVCKRMLDDETPNMSQITMRFAIATVPERR